jgi:hypothetical protein
LPHTPRLPYPPARLPVARGRLGRVTAERRPYLDDLTQGAGVEQGSADVLDGLDLGVGRPPARAGDVDL